MRLIACAAALASFNVLAASVAPDALMCESPEPFQVIAAEGWTSKGGTAQLHTAKLSAEAYRLSSKISATQRGLATQEETIRADSTRRLASGSTTSRAVAADSDARSAEAQVTKYEQIRSTCAASGAAPLAAAIVEQKPISGVAKISVQLNGAPAQVWVRSSDLAH